MDEDIGADYESDHDEGLVKSLRDLGDGGILPKLMLEEAVGANAKTVSTAPAFCLVVRTKPDWVKPIGKAARRLGTWRFVCEPTSNVRAREEQENDALGALARGQRVLCLGSTAVDSIPARLLATADLIVDVNEISIESVARAIEAATKTRPRGLKRADVAGLDLRDAMAAIRPETTATSCLHRLRTARTREVLDPLVAAAPPIEELAGYGEARVWADQLVEDIALWRRGELAFTAIQRNVVVAGGPGVGKSSFVRSIAKSTGLPLFTTSIGTMFATSAGHLDSIVKAIDRLFAEANAKAAVAGSAIVFIDELEGFPSREALTGREGSWWVPVVNHVLTTLDGAMSSASARLIVIGATNYPERLDPALVRPGRLDRIIWIDPPDAGALARIFRQHLGDDLADEDLTGLGEFAIGSTGADVVAFIKAARANARAAGEPLSVGYLIDAVNPPSRLPPDALYRAAIHEAGHAVAAVVLGLHEVRIVMLGGSDSGGRVVFERPQHSLGSAEEHRMEILQLLAGRAAEEVFTGTVSAGSGGADRSDLGRATAILAADRLSYGLGGTLTYLVEPVEALDYLRRNPHLVRIVEEELQEHYRATLDLLRENGEVVRAVADALLARRSLTGAEVKAMVFRERAPLPASRHA